MNFISVFRIHKKLKTFRYITLFVLWCSSIKPTMLWWFFFIYPTSKTTLFHGHKSSFSYSKIFLRQFFYGKISVLQNISTAKFLTAEFPRGEVPLRRSFLTAKFPYDEVSFAETSHGENANIPSALQYCLKSIHSKAKLFSGTTNSPKFLMCKIVYLSLYY